MTTRTAIIIAACALAALAMMWWALGPTASAAGAGALALAAARKVRRVTPPPPVVADDAADDAALDAASVEAAAAAADEAAQGWDARPVRSRPRLDLVLLMCLLPAAVRADPPIRDGCVEAGAYGPHAARAGFGVWVERGHRLHCPCLPAAAYGDVTRLPLGCVAEAPVVAYSLDAHAGVTADLARAGVLVKGLRVSLKAARVERDRQSTAAALAFEDAQTAVSREVELIARLAAQEQATRGARAQAADWWTWRSVVLTTAAVIIAGGAAYGVCHTWGC